MEPFWIDLLIVLGLVAVVIAALVIRRRLRGPHDEAPPRADQTYPSQDARIAEARLRSDRTGFGAGGGF
ncbi:MAG: hypothetical protein Q7T71_04040 [Herbiconiux sp.]|nr:hypothetical protein [Herbiconiux sp.]